MQFTLLLTIFFGVFALAAPLETRDHKADELKNFDEFMGDLLKLGYVVEEYLPDDVVSSEKRADEPEGDNFVVKAETGPNAGSIKVMGRFHVITLNPNGPTIKRIA